MLPEMEPTVRQRTGEQHLEKELSHFIHVILRLVGPGQRRCLLVPGLKDPSTPTPPER